MSGHNQDLTCSICERVFNLDEANALTEVTVAPSAGSQGYRFYIEVNAGLAHYLRIRNKEKE